MLRTISKNALSSISTKTNEADLHNNVCACYCTGVCTLFSAVFHKDICSKRNLSLFVVCFVIALLFNILNIKSRDPKVHNSTHLVNLLTFSMSHNSQWYKLSSPFFSFVVEVCLKVKKIYLPPSLTHILSHSL